MSKFFWKLKVFYYFWELGVDFGEARKIANIIHAKFGDKIDPYVAIERSNFKLSESFD